MFRKSVAFAAIVIAFNVAACAGAKRPSIQPAAAVPGAILWQEPTDLATRDLYDGPWGSRRAPDPKAIYTLVERKHSGVNLGMTVLIPRDANGA